MRTHIKKKQFYKYAHIYTYTTQPAEGYMRFCYQTNFGIIAPHLTGTATRARALKHYANIYQKYFGAKHIMYIYIRVMFIICMSIETPSIYVCYTIYMHQILYFRDGLKYPTSFGWIGL